MSIDQTLLIDAVHGLDGPRLSIPLQLALSLRDIAAAAFLGQAAYLTAVSYKQGRDGWFTLPGSGKPQKDGNLYEKLGSWEALGIGGEKPLKRIRDRLKALGVLEEHHRATYGTLNYRVDLKRYIQLANGTTSGDSTSSQTEKVLSPKRRKYNRRNGGSTSSQTAPYTNKKNTKTRPPPPTPAMTKAPAPSLKAAQGLGGGDVDTKRLAEALAAAEAGIWMWRRQGRPIDDLERFQTSIITRVLEQGQNARDKQAIMLYGARNAAPTSEHDTGAAWPTRQDIESQARPGETYEEVRIRLFRDRRKTAALKDGRRIS